MSQLLRPEAERLVQALAGLAKAQTLYPEGHAVQVRAQQGLAQISGEVLKEGGPLLLGCRDGHLVVGGVAFIGVSGAAEEVTGWFSSREIEGVTLRSGVTAGELARFCRWVRGAEEGAWVGDRIELTPLVRGGELWQRGLRAYNKALGVVVEAYEDLSRGKTPDGEAGRRSVREFTALLQESPSVVQGLSLIKDYDRYTYHHSVNVCVVSLRVGHQWGLSQNEMEVLGVGGLFHDIGKIRTPAEVVRKAGPLTNEEWACMRRHPVHGRELFEPMLHLPKDSSLLVYEHHMHHDGGGYPERRAGYRIHPLSPVVAVADVLDAMTSHRSYNRPLSLPGAIQALGGLRGKALDPAAVDVLFAVLGAFPLGTLVRLVSGELGVVVAVSEEHGGVTVRVVRNAAGEDLGANKGPLVNVASPKGLHAVDPLLCPVNPIEVLQLGS